MEKRYSQITIQNESLHHISNDNWIRIINFATSKNLIFKSTIFHVATFINTLGLLLMEKNTILIPY
jgi:hypothetical protein